MSGPSDDPGSQRALLRREERLRGVVRQRVGGPFGETESEPAYEKGGEADHAHEGHHRRDPDEHEGGEVPAEVDLAREGAEDDGAEGEDPEERALEDAELLDGDAEVGADVGAGEAEQRLVGVVDEEEGGEQGHDRPRASRRHFLAAPADFHVRPGLHC